MKTNKWDVLITSLKEKELYKLSTPIFNDRKQKKEKENSFLSWLEKGVKQKGKCLRPSRKKYLSEVHGPVWSPGAPHRAHTFTFGVGQVSWEKTKETVSKMLCNQNMKL